jgi:glycosyltransferase involved in cell wall biosynthesis
MNILLLSHGINKKYNDNYYAYSHMCNLGDNILAITQRENINKGNRSERSPDFECESNLYIYRLFDTVKKQKSIISNMLIYYKIKKIVSKFNPDIIFCEELGNMMLAIKLKKEFNIPIVLRVEFLFDKNHPYRTMGRTLKFFKNRLTGDYLSTAIGHSIWNFACKHSAAVISCYFGDAGKFHNLNNNYYYVPWATALPKINYSNRKFKNRAIFIGSFDPHKNLKELEKTLPLLFEFTPLQEFWIVGEGDDLDVINNLKSLYPEKINHITSLSRNECLELIQESYLTYSPATRGGWGFIGDSWAMKTPVLVTHNHYDFRDGIDSIVTNPIEMVERVNELYRDNAMYNKILTEAFTRYTENYTAESVGQKYHNICKSVLNNR